MRDVRVLDLDGSLVAQGWLVSRAGDHLDPSTRVGSSRPAGLLVQDLFVLSSLAGPRGLRVSGPGVTFYGSGDFHHVTLAFLGRIRGPFNLLVLDKHPDWMRGIPFLHCGTWLNHALRLPGLNRVYHCGGDLDFDNAYRWLAPWPDIVSGRVVVFPARRRFVRGRWAGIATHPLLIAGLIHRGRAQPALHPYRDDLARFPLYVSVDKDVLTADDAAVNWDSGLLAAARGRDDPPDVSRCRRRSTGRRRCAG